MLVTSDSSFLTKKKLHLMTKIGEGTFSKVYLAKYSENVNNKIQLIATKVINKTRVSVKFSEKFLPRELDVLLKLQHPFIVQVYSIFQHESRIYINMEYAENGDMFTLLRKRTLSETQIRFWFVQILLAFKYMHHVGVVHRDLKCENILLTANYNIRIADFGFARFLELNRKPHADTACGTLSYSSPQLLFGSRPYNPVASDVWAVGIVLYMMANNVAPFPGRNKHKIYDKQMSKEYTFRKNLNRSESLIELTAKFLEPDILKRVKINNALKSSWIREGSKTREMPKNVQKAKIIGEIKNDKLRDPVITQSTLNQSSFHFTTNYILPRRSSSLSNFNEVFSIIEEKEDTMFY